MNPILIRQKTQSICYAHTIITNNCTKNLQSLVMVVNSVGFSCGMNKPRRAKLDSPPIWVDFY